MDALLLAVLNALWQGAALIALVALALRAGLRRNATTACVVWSLTFAVVALLPALDLALARPAAPAAAPPAAAAPLPRDAAVRHDAAPGRTAAVHDAVFRQPRAANASQGAFFPLSAAPALAADTTLTRPAPPVDVARRVDAFAARLGEVATAFARSWGMALLAAWALVAGALLLRLAVAYAAVARIKRGATPIDDARVENRLRAAGHRRRATIGQSAAVESPCAIGFTRPMILIPARLAASLDAEDLARVVLHESAHLQRYDDWINALEQVVCALQFFQPALYFARRSIDFEREVACDDRVLDDAGEPLRYAECLARIVQRHVRARQVAVVPGFVLRRAQVVARVRRIVDRSRDASPHLRLGAAVLGGFVMVATLGIARLQVPVVSAASATPASPIAAPRRIAAQRVLGQLRSHRHAIVAAEHGMHHATSQRAALAHAAVSRGTPSRDTAIQIANALNAAPHIDATAASALVVAAQASPSPCPSVSPAPHARAERAVQPLVVERFGPIVKLVVGTRFSPVGDTVAVARVAPVANANAVVTTSETPRTAVPVVALPRLQSSSSNVSSAGSGGTDLLDAIDEAKYPHPSVDDLIALRNQGVTGDYVRRMGALGRNRPALHELIALASQGVTPEYVATLDARLASPPTLNEVLALRVQGVRAAWLDGMAAIGYPKLTAGDAVVLAVQGVTTAYVRGLLDAGLRNVTPGQLVALRVQGVDGSFVRRLADHGYRNLSVDDLLRLKASGL